MKINRNIFQKKKFEVLDIGDCFMCDSMNVFVKIDEIEVKNKYSVDEDFIDVNALSLVNGGLYFYGANDIVEILPNAELFLGGDKNENWIPN